MTDIHITVELLKAVRRGDLPRRVVLELGWNHLLHLCPTCRDGILAFEEETRDHPIGSEVAVRLLPLVIERHAADDAAMVSLDLALLYLRQNRTAAVKELAEEMQEIFAAGDVHREATAALVLFQEAAGRETLTAELIEEMAVYLKRARENPELRFAG